MATHETCSRCVTGCGCDLMLCGGRARGTQEATVRPCRHSAARHEPSRCDNATVVTVALSSLRRLEQDRGTGAPAGGEAPERPLPAPGGRRPLEGVWGERFPPSAGGSRGVVPPGLLSVGEGAGGD